MIRTNFYFFHPSIFIYNYILFIKRILFYVVINFIQEYRSRYNYASGEKYLYLKLGKKIRPRQKDVDESQTKSLIPYLYKY